MSYFAKYEAQLSEMSDERLQAETRGKIDASERHGGDSQLYEMRLLCWREIKQRGRPEIWHRAEQEVIEERRQSAARNQEALAREEHEKP